MAGKKVFHQFEFVDNFNLETKNISISECNTKCMFDFETHVSTKEK